MSNNDQAESRPYVHPYVIVSNPGTDKQAEYDDHPILSLALKECERLNKKYRGGYDVMIRREDGTLSTEY